MVTPASLDRIRTDMSMLRGIGVGTNGATLCGAELQWRAAKTTTATVPAGGDVKGGEPLRCTGAVTARSATTVIATTRRSRCVSSVARPSKIGRE